MQEKFFAMLNEDTQSKFGREMFAVARAWRRALTRQVLRLGISDGQWSIIDNLNRSGDGSPQGVLADRMGLERSGLVRLLKELEAAGLVYRKENEQDSRSLLVYLTEAGRQKAAEILSIVHPLEHHILSQRSDEEMKIMLEWLGQCRARIDEINAPD